MEVWLLSCKAYRQLPTISFTEYSVGLFSSMQSLTFMRPSVMVPVLSRQSTFTRASISSEYRSCTRVLCVIRRMMPSVSAILVSSSMPEGIMPMTMETVRWIVSLSCVRSLSAGLKLFQLMKNMPIAMGMMRMPTIMMTSFVERISSDFGFLYFFAFAESFST